MSGGVKIYRKKKKAGIFGSTLYITKIELDLTPAELTLLTDQLLIRIVVPLFMKQNTIVDLSGSNSAHNSGEVLTVRGQVLDSKRRDFSVSLFTDYRGLDDSRHAVYTAFERKRGFFEDIPIYLCARLVGVRLTSVDLHLSLYKHKRNMMLGVYPYAYEYLDITANTGSALIEITSEGDKGGFESQLKRHSILERLIKSLSKAINNENITLNALACINEGSSSKCNTE